MYHQVFRSHSAYTNLISGPPRVRLQSVLDHQFRIEFPSTGKKRDPSIPGARMVCLVLHFSPLSACRGTTSLLAVSQSISLPICPSVTLQFSGLLIFTLFIDPINSI